MNLTGYTLTYDDEFNSFTSSPDGSRGYQTTYYFGGRELFSNGDLQYFSDSSVGVNPFRLSNGALQITAAPGTNPDHQPYNSGMITTEGMFSQTYGYFEARVEVAPGAGMWSTFWLLPENKSWPPEIDVLEAFGAPNSGGDGGSNLVAHVNHAPNANDNVGRWETVGGNIYTSYHTYGVDWEPDFITWYIDGQAVQQITTPAGENNPMYMLLNLTVGGWAGSPAGETSTMSIDYVRAYAHDPSATAVALQPVSSPDGVDTTPYGATAASGVIGGGTSGGGGTGTLSVRVSEDAWNGDAHFTVAVDGVQLGGIQTVTASHAAGQWQDIAIAGSIAAGPHTIAVNFINDAWGGSATTDRNMYVQSITVNGEIIPGNTAQDTAANGNQAADPTAAVMDINGTATFHSTGSTGSTTSQISGIVLHVAEDAWNGDAQFLVFVDGHQVGGTQTATASHAQGQVQNITLTGNFGTQGPGTIDVQFINDGWGGTAATDRNLYVQSIDVNGVHFQGNTATNTAANGNQAADPTAAVMDINGTAEFHVNHTAPPDGLFG
jgi:beta-glucanase (GH16 family)